MMKTVGFFLTLLIMASPLVQGQTDSSDGAFQTVKNPLASMEDRKKAVEQLKAGGQLEMIAVLAEIIRNPEESIAFRAYVLDCLIDSNNKLVAFELKKILNDPALSSESRKLALYGLWKKNGDGEKSDLLKRAQNPGESLDIRLEAIGYLSQIKGDWPASFWMGLYYKKGNQTPLRIAALNGMEELGLLAGQENLLIQAIQDPKEPDELRKSVMVTARRLLSPDIFEEELRKLASNTQNSLEMRRFAADNSAANKNKTL